MLTKAPVKYCTVAVHTASAASTQQSPLHTAPLLQILRRLLQQLNATGVTVEQQLNILLELEYLVHQVSSHNTCNMSRCSASAVQRSVAALYNFKCRNIKYVEVDWCQNNIELKI